MMPQAPPRDDPPGIVRGQPACDALRAILAGCAAAFEVHRAALMQSDAPEGPHQARVALRRLRTALEAFEPILRRKPAKALGREAQSIFRTLGTLRDADVVAVQTAAGRSAARLNITSTRLRGKVRRKLVRTDAAGFAGRVLARIAGCDWQRKRAGALAEAPVEVLAARALDAAWQKVSGHGRRIARMTDSDRHRLRKDMKTVRYLTEFFGPLWGGKRPAGFLERLKRLQDALGTLNDLQIAEALLGSSGRSERARHWKPAFGQAHLEWTAVRRSSPWWRRPPRSGDPRRPS